MANPELYVDATVVLTGQPLDYDNLVNAAACTEPGPCNNVRGYFALRGAGDPISARASASLPSTPVALGVTPQDCFDEPCLSGTNLGCHGNDAEAFCAPELPVHIERVIGRLVRVDGDLVFEKVSEGKGGFGYNAATGKYEDLVKSGIIDPALVATVALGNAASVSGLMLTTNVVITELEDDDEPIHGSVS